MVKPTIKPNPNTNKRKKKSADLIGIPENKHLKHQNDKPMVGVAKENESDEDGQLIDLIENMPNKGDKSRLRRNASIESEEDEANKPAEPNENPINQPVGNKPEEPVLPAAIPADQPDVNAVPEVIPADQPDENAVAAVIPADQPDVNAVPAVIPADQPDENAVAAVIPADQPDENAANAVPKVIPADQPDENAANALPVVIPANQPGENVVPQVIPVNQPGENAANAEPKVIPVDEPMEEDDYGSYREQYLNSGYCVKNKGTEQFYATDENGDQLYWTDPNNERIYATKITQVNDSYERVQYPAVKNDGSQYYIYDKGVPVYPENLDTSKIILPIDPITKEEMYIPNLDGKVEYPKDQNSKEYYRRDKHGNEIAISNIYAKDKRGDQYYPRKFNGDEYYLKSIRDNREVGIRMVVHGEFVECYAKKANGDEFYPRFWMPYP